jgi:hypothetical protein
MSWYRTTQGIFSRLHRHKHPLGFPSWFQFQFVNCPFYFYLACLNFLSPADIGKVFSGEVVFLGTRIIQQEFVSLTDNELQVAGEELSLIGAGTQANFDFSYLGSSNCGWC